MFHALYNAITFPERVIISSERPIQKKRHRWRAKIAKCSLKHCTPNHLIHFKEVDE